jgi:hypothetical protein
LPPSFDACAGCSPSGSEPDEIEVTFSTFANGVAPCTSCSDMNTTFAIQRVDDCQWAAYFTTPTCPFNSGFSISLAYFPTPGQWRLRVASGDYESAGWWDAAGQYDTSFVSPVDCAFDNYKVGGRITRADCILGWDAGVTFAHLTAV